MSVKDEQILRYMISLHAKLNQLFDLTLKHNRSDIDLNDELLRWDEADKFRFVRPDLQLEDTKMAVIGLLQEHLYVPSHLEREAHTFIEELTNQFTLTRRQK